MLKSFIDRDVEMLGDEKDLIKLPQEKIDLIK